MRIVLWGLAIAAVTIAAVILVLATPLRQVFAGWGGDLSAVEIIANIITPVGAVVAVVGLIINGRAANLTLDHSIASERAQRFQNACELAASDNAAAKVGGLHLLGALAIEEPKTYLTPTLKVLDATVMVTDQDFRRTNGYFRLPIEPDDSPLPASEMTVIDVLDIIAKIQTSLTAWREQAKEALSEDKLLVNGPYLHRFAVEHLLLQELSWNRFVFGRVQFVNCNLGANVFYGVMAAQADFIDCDLTGVSMEITGPDAQPMTPHAGLLIFENCKTQGLTINGHDYADWLNLPPAAEIAASGSETQPEPA